MQNSLTEENVAKLVRSCQARDTVELGKLEEAIAAFREAIRLKPDFTIVHNALGNGLLNQGKHEEAIAAFREAIRLSPDFAMAYNNLGKALLNHGRHEEAITAYREAIRLQPDFPMFHCNLGLVLVLSLKGSRTDHDEALVHARKAVELAPKVGICYLLLALAEYRLGHWTESLAAGERSMALQNGGDASNWFLMALAHWQRGHKDEARPWFDKAVAWTKQNTPENQDLLQLWTETAELLGQPGPVAAGTSSPTALAAEKQH